MFTLTPAYTQASCRLRLPPCPLHHPLGLVAKRARLLEPSEAVGGVHGAVGSLALFPAGLVVLTSGGLAGAAWLFICLSPLAHCKSS